jgi:hypothetical protein
LFVGTRKFGRAWVSIKGVKATAAVVAEISATEFSQKRVQGIAAVLPIVVLAAVLPPAATAAVAAVAMVAVIAAAATVVVAAAADSAAAAVVGAPVAECLPRSSAKERAS